MRLSGGGFATVRPRHAARACGRSCGRRPLSAGGACPPKSGVFVWWGLRSRFSLLRARCSLALAPFRVPAVPFYGARSLRSAPSGRLRASCRFRVPPCPAPFGASLPFAPSRGAARRCPPSLCSVGLPPLVLRFRAPRVGFCPPAGGQAAKRAFSFALRFVALSSPRVRRLPGFALASSSTVAARPALPSLRALLFSEKISAEDMPRRPIIRLS